MTGCKRSSKRAFRIQAGLMPLQIIAINSSPERAIVSSATPLGLGLQSLVYRGFTPVCSLFRPSVLRVGNFNYLISSTEEN